MFKHPRYLDIPWEMHWHPEKPSPPVVGPARDSYGSLSGRRGRHQRTLVTADGRATEGDRHVQEP